MQTPAQSASTSATIGEQSLTYQKSISVVLQLGNVLNILDHYTEEGLLGKSAALKCMQSAKKLLSILEVAAATGVATEERLGLEYSRARMQKFLEADVLDDSRQEEKCLQNLSALHGTKEAPVDQAPAQAEQAPENTSICTTGNGRENRQLPQ